MNFTNLPQFASYLGTVASASRSGGQHKALDAAGRLVEERAKSAMGTYELGWAQLAPATREDRARRGYPEDEPLLRDGTLRNSISRTVQGDGVEVGTPMEIGLWQELGTRRMPPRSFLRASLVQVEAQVVRLLSEGWLRSIFRNTFE